LKNITPEFKKKCIEENYQWAMDHSWESQTKKFDNILVPFVKYWHKSQEINNYLLEKTKDLENVIDIGSGSYPFENANITIDGYYDCTHKINIEVDKLPHSNYDFVYCRHLLEDLKKPGLLLSEIKKKAKAGYIETPSVYAECCRSIDHDNNHDQIGYAHHNFILWTENKTLFILPKVEEYIKNIDQENLKTHLRDPMIWNNYYLFDSEFNYTILDYSSKEDYSSLIQRAFEMTLINTRFTSNYIIKNIPKNIYLQVDSDVDDSEVEFKDLAGVSWCAERIHDTDLKFQLNQTDNRLFTKQDMIAFALYAPDFHFNNVLEKKEYLENGFETWALHRR
jgi:hypothetical protein